jgi:hypothetical protein
MRVTHTLGGAVTQEGPARGGQGHVDEGASVRPFVNSTIQLAFFVHARGNVPELDELPGLRRRNFSKQAA